LCRVAAGGQLSVCSFVKIRIEAGGPSGANAIVVIVGMN
jgi:hypothetical protein